MTAYEKWLAYFTVGFIIGVIGLAVNGGGEDDWFETVSWMAAWTLLSPLMVLLALVSFFLEKFAGIPRDEDP